MDLDRIKAQIVRGKFIEQQRSTIGLLDTPSLHYEWVDLCKRWMDDETDLVAYIEELEQMVYDCVRLTDIMLAGHSEATYKAITAKYEPKSPVNAAAESEG